MFSKLEVDYIRSQYLARMATVNKKGPPDVVPVGFEFDEKYFWIGSRTQDAFFRSKRYHNVKNGNSLISLVIDDLKSIDPWKPRSIKIYGSADVMDHEGRFGKGKYLRVTPKISWSTGIDGLNLEVGKSRLKTVHED